MKKKALWGAWILMTMVLGAYFGKQLFSSDNKEVFLIGEATYGHYQIEMACETCHSSAFGGIEVIQDACTQCHADELEVAHDSHPKSKFTGPRNADRVEILDARYCVTCHTEHQKEQTHAMGVTLPDDYCYHCHQDIETDRPSHQNLAFDSCASAGCHNYHDNRALYEDFLIEHAKTPWLNSTAKAVEKSTQRAVKSLPRSTPLNASSSRYAQEIEANPDITHQWQASSHAAAGIDCDGCHQPQKNTPWVDKPTHQQCKECHGFEVEGFLSGKHGMRLSGALSASLSPLTPAQSHLQIEADAQSLTHGCNTCHGAHEFNPEQAAVEGCLTCHADNHSQAFKGSLHGQLWQKTLTHSELNPLPTQTAVTCATCHLPRIKKTVAGQTRYAVSHNQNDNFKPNEKMIRSVCMDCHGLQFSLNALADPELINNNFSSKPKTHVESIDWAIKRLESKH